MDRAAAGHGERRQSFSRHTVRLAWIVAAAYLLVVVYASLQPFRGWRAPPPEVLYFLGAPWPRFITLQDVAVNLAAYVPLGLLLSIGYGARFGAAQGVVAATLASALLSLAMEAAQIFLPPRIASNVDLLANSLGALLGAMAAPLLAPSRALGARLHATRHRLFLEGMAADAGAVVVFLWVITQFHSTTPLFGSGNLRNTFDLPSYLTHTPGLAFSSEVVIVLLNLLGVGLLLSALLRDGTRALPHVVGAVVGIILAVKVFTAVTLVQSPSPLAWLTPGAFAGLAGGCLLLYGGARLSRVAQLSVSAACIVAAAVAINFAPENPYQSIAPRLLSRGAGHVLSFSGIVRAISELWPLIATGFLLYALSSSDIIRDRSKPVSQDQP
jgi:VanZ family protein